MQSKISVVPNYKNSIGTQTLFVSINGREVQVDVQRPLQNYQDVTRATMCLKTITSYIGRVPAVIAIAS